MFVILSAVRFKRSRSTCCFFLPSSISNLMKTKESCEAILPNFLTQSQKQGPPKPRLEWAAHRDQRCRYCLSYTAVLVTFLPAASVRFKVTVRVLPSAETTALPLTVTLPSFLLVSDKVWSLTFVYDLVSVLGSPVTG